MAYKLSKEAASAIANSNDFILAHNEELERLHIEAETCTAERYGHIQGQIYQLREEMKLRDRALELIS